MADIRMMIDEDPSPRSSGAQCSQRIRFGTRNEANEIGASCVANLSLKIRKRRRVELDHLAATARFTREQQHLLKIKSKLPFRQMVRTRINFSGP